MVVSSIIIIISYIIVLIIVDHVSFPEWRLE
jgi:hypothetical protein